MTARLPIIRRDADGTIVDGTARALVLTGGLALDDFRDLDGEALDLPPGSAFEVQLAGGEGEAHSVTARFPHPTPASDDSSCPAAIRPFRPTNDAEVRCAVEGPHELHEGELRDYAFPGSVTQVQWLNDDRRTFLGPWPGGCTSTLGCTLPANHPRSCAP